MKVQKKKYTLLNIIPLFILGLFFCVFFRLYILTDDSMHARLALGTIFNNQYDRGDVCLLDIDKDYYIRRIVGMPGDIVTIKHGSLYINDQLCVEEYTQESTYAIQYQTELGYDEYFVLADNRTGYTDSRMVGAINKTQIHRKILYLL